MIDAYQNSRGSRDLTTPFERCFVIRKLGIATINLPAKFEVSISTRYDDIKCNTKCRKWWFGVVRGHSKSLEIALLDRAHMSSY